MALLYVLAALLVLALILLTEKRIRFALLVTETGVSLRASIFGHRIARQYSYERVLGMIALGEKRNKKRKERLRFWDAFHLHGLVARGRLGFGGEAAATAIVCGALGYALEALYAVFSDDGSFSARVTPDFTRKVFWIYLEGMLKMHPGKIIIEFIVKRLKEEYEKWRILSKILWRRPWQSSEKWLM
ncbi:MAG TPA: DUF2953 domain-containing protein [Clostridia bacterium]|nr:DUF2953 domain-containing protein [Clostridia bacterium]